MISPLMDLAADGWTLQADDGFIGHVGPFWTRERDGKTVYGFIAEPRHSNLLDVVQGGMLMTFADRALGVEAWKASGDRPCVTVQFNTQFTAAAAIGSFIEIEPKLLKLTGSMAFLEGSITADGSLVASAQGVWKILRNR